MASIGAVLPSAEFRDQLTRRGGQTGARCYQCATCSSVCELAVGATPFPRRQVLYAQWGLADRLAADPGPWLCHQCNDCNIRCPRDARPGDVMQAVRALVVSHLAFPSLLGKLVGNVTLTWPILIAVPILFWLVLLGATTGLHIPEVNPNLPALEGRFHYEEFVPHLHIYTVYITVSLWVLLAASISGRRFWTLLGTTGKRRGSFLAKLPGALAEVATHKRFSSCDQAGYFQRRWGHFLLMWGFVGAAVTSGFAVVYLYKDYPPFSWFMAADAPAYPVPIDHWVKWLGNLSALVLVVGGVLLFINRLRTNREVGNSTAFDRFFLWTVVAVILTGVLTEAFRFTVSPELACSVYVVHLGVVLTLFITLPYSKFAHIVYRTLAMVHQAMLPATPAAPGVAATAQAPAGPPAAETTKEEPS